MLTAEEKTKQKEMHAKVRAAMYGCLGRGPAQTYKIVNYDYPCSHRDVLLAWGYLRGFPFRRIERTHRIQIREDGKPYEHNLPVARMLHMVIASFDPTVKVEDVQRWLDDPSGAIPAPPPRVKKPYVAEAAE